jgi:tRNA(Arg) A34 adenosine deaminase TadA
MRRAIQLAKQGMEVDAGGPFGCVIVKDDQIIAEAHNEVTTSNDPTAHAEVVAIRKACRELGSFQLEGCTIYCSREPCPMCFGAIYWARPAKVFYACEQADAAAIDFDDQFIYQELARSPEARRLPFVQLLRAEALPVFEQWSRKTDKKVY